MTTAEKQGAAFFDVDKTLLPRMSMEMLLATGLLRGEIPGRFAWVPFLREYIRLLPQGPTTARKANKAYLKGTRPEDVRRWAEDLFSCRVAPHLGERGRRWIAAERARGRAIVLLTGMPDLLMPPLVGFFAPDLAVATALEVGPDGRLTGRCAGVHPYGPAKLEIARDLAERKGWDLSLSSAYGDHASDAYILAGVGEAVAVDPDPGLRRLARAHGWRIVEGDAA